MRQAQVGARFATMLSMFFYLIDWWLNLLSSRRFAAAPRVDLEARFWYVRLRLLRSYDW